MRLNDGQRLAWLRLIRSENVGPATFRVLVNQFGGAQAAIEALPALSRRGGRAQAIRLCTAAEAEAELAAADRAGAHLVALGEHGYPPALAQVDAPPPLIYVKGRLELAEMPIDPHHQHGGYRRDTGTDPRPPTRAARDRAGVVGRGRDARVPSPISVRVNAAAWSKRLGRAPSTSTNSSAAPVWRRERFMSCCSSWT